MKLAIILLILLAFFVSQKPLYAVTDTISSIPSHQMNMDIVNLTPTPIEYQLPYPGILPDNPLYKLKALRDKIIGFLISDPLKKTDFDILQADKRYNAALYLFRQDAEKEMIISDTISKADNYFHEALDQINLAKTQGEDINDFVKKASLSNKKHTEVLHELEKKASDVLLKKLQREEKRVMQMQIEADKKMSKK